MGNGFQFVDIIFFALVAAFIILRLRSVLGKRTGNERRRDPFAKPPAPAEASDARRTGDVVSLPRRDSMDAAPAAAATPLGAALTQVKLADPSFDEAKFEEGARAAFDYIVSAFAAGERAKLKPLLSEEVYANFDHAITAREQDGHKAETTVVRIKSADIVEARMEGQSAFVGVKYVSEQINVTRDAEGKVVEGNPDRIAEATDVWTFARNTRSPDPNWTLVRTDVPQ
ncbi:MAG TPA: Tim44/TimA family putative adaptor protein [Alphaproteobacteria bacterium]|jgi:predicted lipid-binding transport protein (Tim44 family)